MDDSLNSKVSPQTATSFISGRQWAQTISPSLKNTRLGLTLVFFGTLVTIIFIAVVLICSLLMGSKIYNDNGAKFTATILGLLLGIFVKIIGPVLCLAVPAESGVKRFLVGSIVLDLIAIVYTIVQIIFPMALLSIVFYITRFCSIISLFTFVYFLKTFSEYIGRDDLSALGKKVLIGYLIVPVGIIAVLLLLFVVPLFFVVVAYMGLFILIICIFVMYLNLINGLRRALVKENK
jgi:hypothetical protein